MGYRTTERLPLIAKAPSNEGLYYDLYSHAAKQIGCQLTVVRSPKKRLLKMLKEGEIDFYPGFVFTPERANYVHFILNGLPGGEVGISLKSMEEVRDKQQLKGLTLIQSLGAPDFASGVDVNYYTKAELSIPEAIELLRKDRGDFYIYPRSTLLYYLKTHNSQDIKAHMDCCGGEQPLYLAFSSSRSTSLRQTIFTTLRIRLLAQQTSQPKQTKQALPINSKSNYYL